MNVETEFSVPRMRNGQTKDAGKFPDCFIRQPTSLQDLTCSMILSGAAAGTRGLPRARDPALGIRVQGQDRRRVADVGRRRSGRFGIRISCVSLVSLDDRFVEGIVRFRKFLRRGDQFFQELSSILSPQKWIIMVHHLRPATCASCMKIRSSMRCSCIRAIRRCAADCVRRSCVCRPLIRRIPPSTRRR